MGFFLSLIDSNESCRYSWQLTLVILSVTPVILIVMFLQGTCMKVLTEQELSALAGAGEFCDSFAFWFVSHLTSSLVIRVEGR